MVHFLFKEALLLVKNEGSFWIHLRRTPPEGNPVGMRLVGQVGQDLDVKVSMFLDDSQIWLPSPKMTLFKAWFW